MGADGEEGEGGAGKGIRRLKKQDTTSGING